MIFKFENKLFHPSLITCLKIKNLLFHLYKKSGAYCQYVYTINQMRNLLLPPANQVSGKIIFLHLFVILFTGGVGGYPSMPCSRCPGGSAPGGVPDGDPPGRLLLRAVRILLECILVINVKVLVWPTSFAQLISTLIQ